MHDIELLRGEKGANIVYMIDSGADVSAGISAARVNVGDWDADLPPWPAPTCFKGGTDFGGDGRAFIEKLAGTIPDFEKEHDLAPKHRIICGYSLAGLCALYSAYVTDIFAGIYCVSGSLWYDGWIDFMGAHKPLKDRPMVYLSVGDKEKSARNARLSKVEECTVKAREILCAQGANAVFELNPGNHFRDPELRVERAVLAVNSMLDSIPI